LWRLGCREPWVNREERTPGQGDWKVGVNLNWLCPPAIGRCDIAAKMLDRKRIAPGDILAITTRFGGHVICVREVHDTELLTSEYGQPGGCQRVRKLSQQFVDSVFSHIRLALVPLTAAPDLACLDMTGEEIDALAGLLPPVAGTAVH
jgi:hypothetical protein